MGGEERKGEERKGSLSAADQGKRARKREMSLTTRAGGFFNTATTESSSHDLPIQRLFYKSNLSLSLICNLIFGDAGRGDSSSKLLPILSSWFYCVCQILLTRDGLTRPCSSICYMSDAKQFVSNLDL